LYLKNKSIQLIEILLYILPLALLSGPFIPDFFISIMGIIFLINIYLEKNLNYFKNYFSIFFFSYIIYLLISSLFSEFVALSLEASLFYFRFYIFSLSIWFLLDKKKDVLNRFTYFLFLTFILVVINGYFQFFTGTNFFGLETPSHNRLTLLFNESLYLGGFTSRLFPLLVGLLILKYYKLSFKIHYIFIALILFISTDLLIYISGERTALGLLFIATALFIIYLKNFKLIRIISLITSVLLIIVISISFPNIKERNVDHTLRQLGVTANQYSPRHSSIYAASYEIYLDNIFFGSGPKTYREICKKEDYNINKYTCNTHSHNTYLQAMAETGTIGLAYLLIAFMYVIYKINYHLFEIILKRKLTYSDYQVCLLICFILTLWPLQPSMSLFNNYINIIYYFPLGFYLHAIYSNQKNN
jgi:O-antigen ligase